jgi:hypothetical protein
LEDANLSALSEHLLPASKSESSESYVVDSLGSSCNFPARCLSQTQVLSSETCAAGSVGGGGNLLAPSCSNSIHIGVNLYCSGGLVYCNFRNKPLVLKIKHEVVIKSLLYNYDYVQEGPFSLGIYKNYSFIYNDKNFENQDKNSDFLY